MHLLFYLLILVWAACGSESAEEGPPGGYVQALEHFERGEYEVARGVCEAVVEERDFVECYRIIGAALVVAGRGDEALGWYRRAVELDPEYAVLHSDLACLYSQQGRQRAALGRLERAAALAPEAAFIHYNMGRVWEQLGFYPESEVAYMRALALEAGDARVQAALGRLYLAQGRAEAEAHLAQALVLDGENPEAHYGLGRLRAQQGRDAAAAAHFKRIVEGDPQHADAWYGLGQAYAKLGQEEQSRQALARFGALQGRPPRDLELILSNPTRTYPRGGEFVAAAIVEAPTSAPAGAFFTEITAAAGIDFVHTHGAAGEYYIVETLGSGVCGADFDGDGWADLYWVDGHALPAPAGTVNRLYRNGGGSFAPVAGAADAGYGMGCAAADYDGDGDLDLYATNWGANALYRNDGDLNFARVERGVEDARWSTSAAFFDADIDGDLDLYAVNYLDFAIDDNKICGAQIRDYCGPDVYDGQADALLRNDGGAFVDITRAAGLYNQAGKGLGVATVDYDGDGDLDLYVANDGVANFLYRNDGGIYADESLRSATAYNGDGDAEAGMGVAVGDYDGDLRPDLFVTNLAYETNTLYGNEGDGTFVDRTDVARLGESSLRRVGFGAHFFDANHDGAEDLFAANGHILAHIEALSGVITHAQANQLWRNDGGVFTDLAAFDQQRVSRGSALADWDLDGDLDLAVANNGGRGALWRNDMAKAGHWLQVVLRGVRGVGAKIFVESGEQVQVRVFGTAGSYLSQGEGVAHFGVGDASEVAVRVVWGDGQETRLQGMVVDRRVYLEYDKK